MSTSINKLNTQVGVRVEDNEKFGTHTVGQGLRYQLLPKQVFMPILVQHLKHQP
jgi:outer membrane cobalamin receptor